MLINLAVLGGEKKIIRPCLELFQAAVCSSCSKVAKPPVVFGEVLLS